VPCLTSIDFVELGLAIFVGGVIGVLATFAIGNPKISLGTSIGTLLAGLLVGHLRTHYPLFGRIPTAPCIYDWPRRHAAIGSPPDAQRFEIRKSWKSERERLLRLS
jgi:hypothetical protein